MVKVGIIDPLKVIRTALVDAARYLLATTSFFFLSTNKDQMLIRTIFDEHQH